MSWMRSPVYAWGDGRFVHLWACVGADEARVFDNDGYEEAYAGGIEIEESVFDALVLYRYAELCADKKLMRRAVKRAKKGTGNFGSYDFQAALGKDPSAEFQKRLEELAPAVADPKEQGFGAVADPPGGTEP